MKKNWLLSAVLLCSFTACQPLTVSQSADFFLPPELGSRLAELQSFPGAWWSYVVVIRPTTALCEAVKSQAGVSRVGCQYSPADLKNILQPWLQDLPLREPPPSRNFLIEKMNLALAKASAPLGSEIQGILRSDPLGSYQQLLLLLQSLNPLKLEYRSDFLRFPGSDAAVIPMLFEFPRTDTDRTASLRAIIEQSCDGKCGELFLSGLILARRKIRP